MKISYGITVCDEHEELMRLLSILITNKRDEDEIVVQCDQGNTTPEVYQVLDQFYGRINVIEFPLKGNFAIFKNNLKKHCKGEWIIQLDSDEFLTIEFLQNLHLILQDNPTTEVFLLPRINVVDNLGLSHVQKWKWNISKKENFIEEKEFDLDSPQDLDEYALLKQYGLIIEESVVS
jgi:glycosyltransferase involved in cell wall biosynthesis